MSQSTKQQPHSLSQATKKQVQWLIDHSHFIKHKEGKLNTTKINPKVLIVDFQNYINSFGIGILNDPNRVAFLTDKLFAQICSLSDDTGSLTTVYLMTKTYHKNSKSHMNYFERVNKLNDKYSDKLDIIYMAYDGYLRNGDDILVLATAYLMIDEDTSYSIISNDKFNKKEDIDGFYKFISNPKGHKIISVTFP